MSVELMMGDSVELMEHMHDDSVDAIITDPPYGVGIADWDDEMPSQHFLDECLRVSSGLVLWFGSASLILNFADYDPRPDRLLIWSPKFTLSKVAKNGYAYRYHPIALWRYGKQSTVPWDVLDDMTECGNWWEHPATKPKSLMRKLVAASGARKVLDPFMGSGTTGVACVELGVDFVGYEIDPGHFETSEIRIRKAELQPLLL